MVHSFIARFAKPRLLATFLLLGVGVTPLNASAAPAWHWNRVVTYVVVADGHVQAAVNINDAVNFISVPVTDVENARRFQDIMTAALLSGRKVNIIVDPVSTSSSRGCGNLTNCRIAIAYGVTN
jgi:hypothetical protein